MEWARKNPVFASYVVLVVLGILALGYLVFASFTRYSQVSAEYDAQVTEMKRLLNLSPFPDANNLRRYSEVAGKYTASVTDLQKKLVSFQAAPENPPPTPLQFQDRLRRVVEDVTRSAQDANVGLPENFYLGFEQYRGAPPENGMTADLSLELDAIRDLVDILIRQHVDRLTSLVRTPLPREGATAAAAATVRPGGAPAAATLVTRNPVQIEFVALPSVFRETLNRITGAPRIYVISELRIVNEAEKGPSRGGGDKTTAAAPAAPAAPAATPDASGAAAAPTPDKSGGPLRYVVGLEKISVVARIDLVRVEPLH